EPVGARPLTFLGALRPAAPGGVPHLATALPRVFGGLGLGRTALAAIRRSWLPLTSDVRALVHRRLLVGLLLVRIRRLRVRFGRRLLLCPAAGPTRGFFCCVPVCHRGLYTTF